MTEPTWGRSRRLMVVDVGANRGIEQGCSRRWSARALVAAASVLALVAACSGSTAAPTPPSSLAPGSVLFVARGTAFSTTNPVVPANTAWTLVFDNEDNLPHNVIIKDSSGATASASDVFTGPATRSQVEPALAPGTYAFLCAVHPQMQGTLTVK
jgi:plastocyanin